MSKSSIFAIVIIGLVALVVSVIRSAPASLAMGYVNQFYPGFYAQGVTGTVWNGQAANVIVRVQGATQQLGKTEWTLGLPWLTNVALEFKAQADNQTAEGNVDVSLLSRSVEVSAFSLSLPANKIREFYPVPAKVEGNIGVTIKHLEFDGEQLQDVEGALTWENAVVDIGSGINELGSYVAEITTVSPGKYEADIAELKGNLGLKGKVGFELATKAYDADLTFKPSDALNDQTKVMISQLGRPNSSGELQFKHKGRL